MTKKKTGKDQSFVYVNCSKAEKASYIRAAKGQKLSTWIISALNDAARKSNQDRES